MIKLYFIRHSSTKGNEEKRHIGTTDESLSSFGCKLLEGKRYPKGELLFVSPMKRCVETARILYPRMTPIPIEELKECNFGEFENKNAKELAGNSMYQKWIDSNGTLGFPKGESREEFLQRNIRGFKRALEIMIKQEADTGIFVVHGGTIMNLLHEFGEPRCDFYHWQVSNGCGYSVSISKSQWINGTIILNEIEKLEGEFM